MDLRGYVQKPKLKDNLSFYFFLFFALRPLFPAATCFVPLLMCLCLCPKILTELWFSPLKRNKKQKQKTKTKTKTNINCVCD